MSLLKEFRKLNEVCQKPRYKEVGNWMVRNIIREACVPTTYFLLKTPITANQVTFFALLLGIAGCIVFLAASKLFFLWFAVLLHLSYYFDHVDGQIARCKKQVSLSGMMFDFITHYIIYGAIVISLGMKAYFESGDVFYVFCGAVGAISLISFNLLEDSKYRAFFVEMLKRESVKIKRQPSGENKKGSKAKTVFSIFHKTCEMHVIINTITVAAILQFFGLEFMTKALAVYYAAFSLFIAAAKTFFVVTTRKPDKEFKNIFEI
ncbi:MAG: CDP-alcohol phosphatidyltransferase family protein [Candidatus Omnitrophota bacterium]